MDEINLQRNGSAREAGESRAIVKTEDHARQVHREDVATASPIISDSGDVVRKLELAKGKGMFSGIATLARLRYEAWLEDKLRVQIDRQLDTREKLAERHSRTVVAENALKSNIYAGQTADQVNMAQLNQARKQRLFTDLDTYVAKMQVSQVGPGTELPALPGCAPPVAAPAATVDVHISDDQIEALAIRAVVNLGPEGAEEDHWEEYRQKLYSQLPQNVAQEVEQRIQEMRSVLR